MDTVELRAFLFSKIFGSLTNFIAIMAKLATTPDWTHHGKEQK